MIILHIVDWYRPIGGAEKLLFDTLAGLEQCGHENIIVYNDHPDQLPSGKRPEYACKGLECAYFIPTQPQVARESIGRVKEIINKHNPDVCHIHNLQNPYLVEFLIKALPCARSIHDPRLYCFTFWKLLPDNSICHYPIGSACIEEGCLSPGIFPRNNIDYNSPFALRHYLVHKSMKVLIAESSAQIDVLVESGFSPDQIEWLPNFTPLMPRAEVESFVKEQMAGQETPVVLFVGRASYEKGTQVLLDACKYIKSRCKIVLITAGPMLEELQEQARKYGKMVEVIGGLPYEETKKWYAKASCIIVPSVWLENFCLVGLEAYGNMKPVIGSRIGGIKDWLKDGETGWLVPPGDPQNLARQIDNSLAEPDKLAKMGRNGFKRAEKYYNKELYLSRLTAIYDKAIGKFQGKL